jgi:predicted DNA-binding protein
MPLALKGMKAYAYRTMPRTTIVIKEAADKAVREIAEKRDRSRNYVINEAIAFYLEHRNDYNGSKPIPKKKAGSR